MESTTVAVDLAKSVFEVAVANERGQISERKRFGRTSFMRFLTKRPPCRVVMEACGTAHYWGRVAQEHGHQVTLLPPNYVRPFVRRNKTDRADAEALVDASRVERIPAVPIKRPEQQALVALHRVREQWMTTRTARINALRGLLGEHGLNLPPGAKTAVQAVPALLESATALPAAMRRVLASVHEEVRALELQLSAARRGSSSGPRAGRGAFPQGYIQTGATPPKAGRGSDTVPDTVADTTPFAVPRQRHKRGGRSRLSPHRWSGSGRPVVGRKYEQRQRKMEGEDGTPPLLFL